MIFKDIKWRVEQIFYGTPKSKGGCYILIDLATREAKIRVELKEKEWIWARNKFRRNKSGKLVKITKKTPEWVKVAILHFLENS